MRTRHAVPLVWFVALTAGWAGPIEEGTPLIRAGGLDQFELVGIGPDAIAIEGNEVRLAGKPLGYFATRVSYRDFVLTFEWKFDRPDDLTSDAKFRGNSGVLLRIGRPHKVWPEAVEVQLAQADPGSLFTLAYPGFQSQSHPEAQRTAIKPVGEWNRLEVTCRGGSVVSLVNGVEVARGDGARPEGGPIGWQSEGKPVRFRDLRIKPLP